MPNPVKAFKNTTCDNCDESLEEGDDLYFTDEGRMCASCAHEEGYVCECGNFKKNEYEKCYQCKDNE